MIRKLFTRLIGVAKCRPGKQFGLHGVVLDNLGGMSDAKLCLRCGKERYDDSRTFGPAQVVRSSVGEWDHEAIRKARKLPGGIDYD